MKFLLTPNTDMHQTTQSPISISMFPYSVGPSFLSHTLWSETIFANRTPFKNDEKCFLFHLNKGIVNLFSCNS